MYQARLNYDLGLSLFGDKVGFKEMHIGAKLTRGELVMVSFMCQFDWPHSAQIKLYFWVYL